MTRQELLRVLNLDEEATSEEIESSYAMLRKLWHADRFSDNDELSVFAASKREEITHAYRTLIGIDDDASPLQLADEHPDTTNREVFHTREAWEDPSSDDMTAGESTSPLRIWPIAIFCILCMLVSAAAILKAFSPPNGRQKKAMPLALAVKTTPEIAKRPSLPESATTFKVDFFDGSIKLKEKHIVFARVSEDMFKQRDAIYVLGEKGDVRKSFKSYTPDLINASIRCDVEKTARLLEDRIDIELTDTMGDTALIWAVRRGCLPIVRMLLDKGANVHATSRNGFTPYVWSRLHRSKKIARALVDAGAKTEGGVYWWRHEEDGEAKWLDRALSNACRNRNCDLD